MKKMWLSQKVGFTRGILIQSSPWEEGGRRRRGWKEVGGGGSGIGVRGGGM